MRTNAYVRAHLWPCETTKSKSNSRNASTVISVLKVSFIELPLYAREGVARDHASAQEVEVEKECACFVRYDKVYVPAISLQRVMGEILRLPVLKLIIHSRHTSRFPLCGSQRMYFHMDAGVIHTSRASTRHVRGFSCTHLPESELCKLFTDSSARDLYFFGWIRTGEIHVRYTSNGLTDRFR